MHTESEKSGPCKSIWLTLAVVVVMACSIFTISCSKSASTDQTISDDGTVEAESVSTPTDPFYVLLIGNDTRVGTVQFDGDAYAHADILCLMRIDPATYTVTLVTIPRDTRADINGSVTKINEALNVGGPELQIFTVEQLTGVQIDHYLMFDFVTYEAFIDAIGGITVDVPKTVAVSDPLTDTRVRVEAGIGEDLDGAHALVFARARKGYGEVDQDAYRQMNVRTSIMTIISKTATAEPALMESYLTAFDNQIATDWDADEMNALVLDFVVHYDQVTIYSATGPYKGAIDEATAIWLVYPDDEGVWSQVISVTDAGGDPSGIVATPDWADVV